MGDWPIKGIMHGICRSWWNRWSVALFTLSWEEWIHLYQCRLDMYLGNLNWCEEHSGSVNQGSCSKGSVLADWWLLGSPGVRIGVSQPQSKDRILEPRQTEKQWRLKCETRTNALLEEEEKCWADDERWYRSGRDNWEFPTISQVYEEFTAIRNCFLESRNHKLKPLFHPLCWQIWTRGEYFVLLYYMQFNIITHFVLKPVGGCSQYFYRVLNKSSILRWRWSL